MTREEQKDERRKTIVKAAEALIRETGSTEFSVGVLAKRAKLSVATIYNLMNSKSTVLYALLVASLDRLVEVSSVAGQDGDPISVAIRASETTAGAFTADPEFLKPLYRYLLGVVDPTHRTAFTSRALAYWVEHLQVLDDAQLLPPGIGLLELAREYQIHFAGALDHWVQDEFDDATFSAHVRYGGLLRLLALGQGELRDRLMRELGATSPAVRDTAAALLESLPKTRT